MMRHPPSMAASAEIFERTTRRYGKPAFDLASTVVDWKPVAVTEEMIGQKFGEYSPTRTYYGHAADKKAKRK